MATQMGILSHVLVLTIITGLLPILIKGNALDQRVLQREIGDSSPEIISINDKDDFRDIEEQNDFDLRPKLDDQSIENAFLEYLYTKRMMNKLRARTDSIRAQKKRSYWKQCAFNAVSCFG